MLYDATKIAEQLDISKVTAYAKMKLPEVKPFIIIQNGKSFVDEKGLDAIKQSLKYNQSPDEEVSATEVDIIKDDMIETLKHNIQFLEEQLNVKDEQIQGIKKLFENTQVLFRSEQEKNNIVLELPEVIKDRDIELVNKLTEAMDKQRAKREAELQLQKEKGLFYKLFNRKK